MDFKNIRRGFSRANLVVAGIGALIGLLLIVIPVGFLLDVVFFIMGIAYAFILLIFIVTLGTEEAYELWRFILWSSAFALCLGFTIIFHAFIKPSNKKKIVLYRRELERINAQALLKAAGTYALYGDKFKQEQVKKHAEEREKTLKQTEENKGENDKETPNEEQKEDDSQNVAQ